MNPKASDIIAERNEAVIALARCAKERDSALAEFRLARRDRAALAGHAESLVRQVEKERDNLKFQLEWFDRIARELDALRAEVARQAALVNELQHQRATATAEIDRLDALNRDYRDAAAPDAP